MSEAKQAKRSPGPDGGDRKSGVRDIKMGNWSRNNSGPYMYFNINGSDFPINQANPLLPRLDLKLSQRDNPKYFDAGWSSHHKIHIVRTVSAKHADEIASAVVARCRDLTFNVDLTGGKWYDNKGALFWNVPLSLIAFVDMGAFVARLETIFLNMERTSIENVPSLSWAENNPAIVFHCTNEVIEEKIDAINDMCDKFGFELSMIKINNDDNAGEGAQS